MGGAGGAGGGGGCPKLISTLLSCPGRATERGSAGHLADAIVDEGTVVVEVSDADATDLAVLGAEGALEGKREQRDETRRDETRREIATD